jgi:hypothetical protein
MQYHAALHAAEHGGGAVHADADQEERTTDTAALEAGSVIAMHHSTFCMPCMPQGVEAVAVHGDKDQEERSASMAAFKAGQKDVLVATDVASKGLDFPDIQHVINFDMPDEVRMQCMHFDTRCAPCLVPSWPLA